MQINCCILENESIYINQLSAILKEWAGNTACRLHIDSATSETAFNALDFMHYDIIFIDIVLDNQHEEAVTGIDIAHRLRLASYTNELVFLTNFEDYVFEGYPVHALDYLLKPASYERIARCMNQLIEKQSRQNFIFRTKDALFQIPYGKMIYLSSWAHYTDIITTDKTYRIPQSIKNTLKMLPAHFVQCHRTLIVNLYCIESMSSKEIYLTNHESIPIGQTYLESLRKSLLSLVQNKEILK